MKTEVICVASYAPKESYYIFEQFKASVRRFGVEPRILGWHQEWHGLMTKPRRFREYLRTGQCEGDVLIVCDAYDVVFAAHPDEIGEFWLKMFPAKSHPVLFNAERNCFPRGDLAATFDEIAFGFGVTSPWKYLNSGFMVGRPAEILALLESMDLDSIPDDHQLPDRSWFNPNDQEHFTLAFLKQPVPMMLDYGAYICMTGHGTTVEQLDFSGPRIKQNITGTYPMAFHFNGEAKNVLQPAVLAYMKL